MNKALSMIQPESALLLVIDLQERLLAAMPDAPACLEGSRRMIEAARVLGLPTVVTEQYPQGLGPTHETVKPALAGVPVITKMRFSACVEELFEHLGRHKRPHIVVVGVEAHVCVLQTVLDLLRLGYQPYVCADAVCSRRPLDRQTAVERMRQAGAIITTSESVTLEMVGQAGTDAFKQILKIIK